MKLALIVALLACVGLYCVGVAILAVQQRRFIYVPDARRPELTTVGLAEARVLVVRTSDGLKPLAWLAPAHDDMQPMVLYLHGNAGNIGDRAARFARLNSFGWGVLLLEYRGYGGTAGVPTEAGLFEDVQAAYAALMAMGIPGRRILLWGESLGTGLAVRLATEREIGAVLLESPYTSIAAIAQRQYPFVPVDWLLRDRFDLIGRIAAVRAPVLVMTGAKDEIVPPAMGRAVFAAAHEPKAFWLAPDAGHNDLAEAGALEAARAFISERWKAAS